MPTKKGLARIFKLPRLLDNSPNPVALVSDAYQVVYANDACCQWLDIPPAELLGKQIAYSPTRDDSESRANGICPNPLLFSVDLAEHRKHDQGFVHAIQAGNAVFRRATFSQIQTDDGDHLAVLVVAQPEDFAPSTTDATQPLDWHQLLAQLEAEPSQLLTAPLVGSSDHAQRLRRQVDAAAQNNADCLVIGPAGSGREFLARTIFSRRNQPNAQLVPIHCEIADSQLIQSAIKNWVFDRRSNESADWLLLLNVDQLSVDAQSELLGYTKIPEFQMPVMATSSSDLLQLTESGHFSRSLAIHLSVQCITIESLEARIGDLPLLIQSLIENANRDSSHQLGGISDDAMAMLMQYHWPRNFSELKLVIDAAHAACSGAKIQIGDLPDDFRQALSAAQIGYYQLEPIDLTLYLESIEKELIARALAQTDNNKTKAAQILGISRARLLRRSKSLKLIGDRSDDDQTIDESEFKEAE